MITDNTTTICAISTPSGVGGIAVIRVSGNEAFDICDKVFISQSGKKLSETEAYKVVFGKIVSEPRAKNQEQRQENSFLIPHSSSSSFQICNLEEEEYKHLKC